VERRRRIEPNRRAARRGIWPRWCSTSWSCACWRCTGCGWERELLEQAERDRAGIESSATTLQRSLIPPTLPAIMGLELAAHYRTASTRLVGGDFYDVFALTGGRWAVVMGDVCGKGAPAASLTSFIRYTLRSLVTHHDDPPMVLAALNSAMIAEQSLDALPKFCTVVFTVLTPYPATGPGGFEVTVAAGGHPPPYLLPATGGVQELSTPGGTLVGMVPDARFVVRTAHLGPGDALVLYTDVLTEAHTHEGVEFGQEAVAEFLDQKRFDLWPAETRTFGGNVVLLR
jgi:sigma-B regulation protein RsbU (phosphoserine phosphatase)